jgi:hypothetical protein
MTGAESRHEARLLRTSAGTAGWISACGLACLLLIATTAPSPAACRFVPIDAGITDIGAGGVLHLDDGTQAQITDIAIIRPDDALDLIRAQQASIRRLADGEHDRWGRLPVTLTGTGNRSVIHDLVRRGFARVDPGMRPTLCDPGLLEIEAEARRYRRGLWQDAASRPINARDTSALLSRLGEFVLVEGRVESVGIRTRTTFIDLTGRWRGGFTVTVPDALWQEVVAQMYEAHGLGPDDLTGRRIRVRGVMQSWRGPAIELAIAAFIEILDNEP